MTRDLRRPSRSSRWLASPRASATLLVALLCFLGVDHLAFLAQDHTPLVFDAADLYGQSVEIHSLSSLEDLPRELKHRPPLPFLLALGSYALFGASPDVAAGTNLVFVVVLVLGAYAFGAAAMDRTAGLLAATIASTCPGVFGMSRLFMSDFPATAMVPLTLLLLLKSGGFTRPLYSALAGLAVGVGTSIRVPFPLFVVGPALVVLLWRPAGPRRSLARLAINLLVALGCFLLVVLPWVLLQWAAISRFWDGNAGAALGDDLSSILSPWNLVAYLEFLAWDQMYLVYATASAGAFVFCLRRHSRLGLFLLAGFLVPYAFFTVDAYKCSRYMLPAVVPCALACGLALARIGPPLARKITFCAVGVFAAAQYLALSYWPGASAVFPALRETVLVPGRVRAENYLNYGLFQPVPALDWPGRLADGIEAAASGAARPGVLICEYGQGGLLSPLMHIAVERRWPWRVSSVRYWLDGHEPDAAFEAIEGGLPELLGRAPVVVRFDRSAPTGIREHDAIQSALDAAWTRAAKDYVQQPTTIRIDSFRQVLIYVRRSPGRG